MATFHNSRNPDTDSEIPVDSVSDREAYVSPPTIGNLLAVGLTEREIGRIMAFRQKYQDSLSLQQRREAQRLSFARWLYERGVLKH